MPHLMAEVLAFDRGLGEIAFATPPESASASGLASLPAEWVVVDDITIPGGPSIRHCIVGPNGIFTVGVDPEPMPAIATPDGLYRNGVRVTTPVKHALLGAHMLRRSLALDLVAYPILVSRIAGERHHLDRLGVVRGERIAEHVWSHPGTPLRRSQRHEILWSLRHLTN